MKVEMTTAVNFITRLLRGRGPLSKKQLQHFSRSLEEALGEHCQHHWFPDTPFKGSGYQWIRINRRMDPLVGKAAYTSGLSMEQVRALLPCELTVWVDPYEVSYRIGENGSIGVLYKSTPLPLETHLNSVMTISS